MMKERKLKMKKTVKTLMACMMCAGVLAGCSSNKDEKKPLVSVAQIVEHTSLNEIRDSFKAEMERLGYKEGENIAYDFKDAGNDPTTANSIMSTFAGNKSDVIVAIATPTATAAANYSKDIPIVFSAVTDPVAAEVVADMEKPGGNVTGTSDVISVEKIMGLAQEITPGFKTIGTLYNSSETNSVSAVEALKEFAEKNSLEVIESAITSTNEIQPAAQNLAKKCDIVFSPTDNTVASSIATANQVFIESKIPFYVGADSMVKDGAFATYGVDYEYLGQQTADMVAEIINGADPGEMPVRTMDEMAIYINSQTAADMGITIPQDILDKATDLAKEDL